MITAHFITVVHITYLGNGLVMSLALNVKNDQNVHLCTGVQPPSGGVCTLEQRFDERITKYRHVHYIIYTL